MGSEWLPVSQAQQIVLNGKPASVAAATLAELVVELGMTGDRMAVERNREIVPRRQWALTPVTAGDQIEVVQFVGGG